MDLPPLDDARWDDLLEAVLGEQQPTTGQRPTTLDASAALATPFPAALRRAADGADHHRSEDEAQDAYA